MSSIGLLQFFSLYSIPFAQTSGDNLLTGSIPNELGRLANVTALSLCKIKFFFRCSVWRCLTQFFGTLLFTDTVRSRLRTTVHNNLNGPFQRNWDDSPASTIWSSVRWKCIVLVMFWQIWDNDYWPTKIYSTLALWWSDWQAWTISCYCICSACGCATFVLPINSHVYVWRTSR